MDALTALHSRTSANLLDEPGPNDEQLENIVKAALRACDHRKLQPWRFLLIEGDERKAFGSLMAEIKKKSNNGVLSEELTTKLQSKPFRAPTIIAVVAKVQQHEKVPEIEQVLSAGAAAQMMMVAAHAQGLGAIWRSGSMMFSPLMLEGLGLAETDRIVGFLYLGQARVTKTAPELDTSEFLHRWTS